MKNTSQFQISRMRRMRHNATLRKILEETHLTTSDLILPIFTEENVNKRIPLKTLPDIYRESEETLPQAIKEAQALGIKAVILFGVSHHKDSTGSDSLKKNGLLARMIKIAKQTAPEMVVIADVCFCEYTNHGHCGVLNKEGYVDNDATLQNLKKQTVIAAQAGADIIAPSGMMDGMVAAIRTALDEKGCVNIPILSYAAKFASHFYGPFRDAAGCSLGQGQDRKGYQMNPANAEEALREIEIDLAEGADMIMVKPGLHYLDIIKSAKENFNAPLFAYHVSGEFSMLKAAAKEGYLNYEDALMETLLSFKRAGCTGIITYGALDAARILKANKSA